MTYDRPALRNWSILVLHVFARRPLVELRIERKTYEKHSGPNARTRLCRRPALSSPATMDLEAWIDLRSVLEAAGAIITERTKTKADDEPAREADDVERPG